MDCAVKDGHCTSMACSRNRDPKSETMDGLASLSEAVREEQWASDIRTLPFPQRSQRWSLVCACGRGWPAPRQLGVMKDIDLVDASYLPSLMGCRFSEVMLTSMM
jgi:hypothetical protein